jgi:hypothetical protein
MCQGTTETASFSYPRHARNRVAVCPRKVMPQIQDNMRAALPPGKFIAIFPLARNHLMTPTVRKTNTKLVI